MVTSLVGAIDCIIVTLHQQIKGGIFFALPVFFIVLLKCNIYYIGMKETTQ